MDDIYDRRAIRKLNALCGNYFTKKNGYNFKKGLSRSRHKTLLKYLAKMNELTQPPFIKQLPAKGERKILFEFTGQSKFRKFKYAIIRTPEKTKAKVGIDKKAPKGQQVIIQFPKIKRFEMRIPKEYVMYFLHNDMRDEFVNYINDFAPDAVLFVLNTEGGSMWRRTAGDAEALADIIFHYAMIYGAKNFHGTDYSHFENWFDSISCFTDYDRAIDLARREVDRQDKSRADRVKMTSRRYEMRYSSLKKGYFKVSDGDSLERSEFIPLYVARERLKEAKAILKANNRGKKNGKAKPSNKRKRFTHSGH